MQKVKFLNGQQYDRETGGNIETTDCNEVRITNIASVATGATAYCQNIPIAPQTFTTFSCNAGELITNALLLTFSDTGDALVVVNRKVYVK